MRDPCKENSAGAVFVRLGGELYDRLEDFRRRQAKIPHRSEALRSLIERALTASDMLERALADDRRSGEIVYR
jgi:metal-responsive CopG/Arc/MetJ family transcriptional regulator